MTSWLMQSPPAPLPAAALLHVWPIPSSVVPPSSPAGSSLSVSKDFAVNVASDAPPELTDAAQRYQDIIRAAAFAGRTSHMSRGSGAADELSSVTVTVLVDDVTLTFETDYSYSLKIPSEAPWEAVVSAKSIYGAMYVQTNDFSEHLNSFFCRLSLTLRSSLSIILDVLMFSSTPAPSTPTTTTFPLLLLLLILLHSCNYCYYLYYCYKSTTRYGLETLAQVVANGTVPSDAVGVSVDDAPMYRYRGLMIDTGRRFVPKPDVLNSLDAMSYAKMVRTRLFYSL